MSVYGEIIDQVVTDVAGLLPTLEVRRRALPKHSETLDTLPAVVVAPGVRGESAETFSAEGQYERTYPVDVVVVSAMNHDFDDFAEVLDWREKIVDFYFPATLSGVSEVFETEVRPLDALERGHLNRNYHYSGLTLLFHTAEVA